MSKIDELVAERRAFKWPSIQVTSLLEATIMDDGDLFIGENGLTNDQAIRLANFIHEWYADPAPAQPATGWRCAKTDPPMNLDDVAVWRGTSPPSNTKGFRAGYCDGGVWRVYTTDGVEKMADVMKWHPLPTPPEPSAVA